MKTPFEIKDMIDRVLGHCGREEQFSANKKQMCKLCREYLLKASSWIDEYVFKVQ